jgi:hypothetical protein
MSFITTFLYKGTVVSITDTGYIWVMYCRNGMIQVSCVRELRDIDEFVR